MTPRFCSSKCIKSFKVKKNPRKTKWTKAYRKFRGKEMTIDKTYEFEKKRNVPIKYDRELWLKTIVGMKRIQEIRKKREDTFIRRRLAAGAANRKESALKLITNRYNLLKTPVAMSSEEKEKLKNLAQTLEKPKKTKKKVTIMDASLD